MYSFLRIIGKEYIAVVRLRKWKNVYGNGGKLLIYYTIVVRDDISHHK